MKWTIGQALMLDILPKDRLLVSKYLQEKFILLNQVP